MIANRTSMPVLYWCRPGRNSHYASFTFMGFALRRGAGPYGLRQQGAVVHAGQAGRARRGTGQTRRVRTSARSQHGQARFRQQLALSQR